jgi:hypothetical protein
MRVVGWTASGVKIANVNEADSHILDRSSALSHARFELRFSGESILQRSGVRSVRTGSGFSPDWIPS